MTKRQKLHKKLIKFQNRNGKIEGKSIWIELKKQEKTTGTLT
jgi:hypothetical protein